MKKLESEKILRLCKKKLNRMTGKNFNKKTSESEKNFGEKVRQKNLAIKLNGESDKKYEGGTKKQRRMNKILEKRKLNG